MSAPDRIRSTGSPDDQRLLRLGDPAVPPGLQVDVRRALEARIAAGRARRRVPLVWALAGTLVAGTALAYGVREVHGWLEEVEAARTAPPERSVRPAREALAPAEPSPAPAEPAPVPADPPPTPAVGSPLPQAEVEAPQATPTRPRKRVPVPVARPAPRPQAADPGVGLPPGWGPARQGDLNLRGGVDDGQPGDKPESPTAPPPPPGAGELVILREGRRDVKVFVTANRITGVVRDTPISLRVFPAQIIGKIGGQPVNVWMVGRNASGEMAGWDSGFVLTPTWQGDLLRGEIPGQTVRVEHGPDMLSWYPGCGREVPAVAPNVYEGVCDGKRRVHVVIPEALARMPALPRLILLGLLLTEKDPVFQYHWPRLFPPEP